jgi:NAD+ diphosphatase
MAKTAYKYCPLCGETLHVRQRGRRARPSCPDDACGFVHWDNPIPVVAAIVQYDDDVILVRSHGWPEHWYGLVAGFVEPNESIEGAIHREVIEEIGLEPASSRFLGSYPFDRMNQILFVFHMRAVAGSVKLCTTELADFKRVPIDELIPWSRGTGLAVRDWLASLGHVREPVEFGQHLIQSSSVNSKS